MPSRIARNPNLRSKLEWGFVFHYHLLVTAGLVMVIIGIVHLINGEMGNSTKILLRVGIAVVVLCWGLLFPWIFISFTPRQRDKNAPAYAEGTLVSSIQLYATGDTANPIIAALWCYRSSTLPWMPGDLCSLFATDWIDSWFFDLCSVSSGQSLLECRARDDSNYYLHCCGIENSQYQEVL